jgi:hypothetical protein
MSTHGDVINPSKLISIYSYLQLYNLTFNLFIYHINIILINFLEYLQLYLKTITIDKLINMALK